MPFLLGQFLLAGSLQSSAGAGTSKHKGTCVTRIMQHEQSLCDAQLHPDQLPILRSTSGSVWEQQLCITEGFHDSSGRTEAPERFKQKPDALLYLLVGIEHHLTLSVIKKPDWKRHLQFATSRFAQ